MQELFVSKIIKQIENGCTQPLLALVSDGALEFPAVIKTRGNQQGILTLINEWICYRLACKVDLLMPNSGVAVINEESDTQLLQNRKNIQKDWGHCFYSGYIRKSTILNESIMQDIQNKEMYEKIILFDHIIYNKDRNRGNLLISTDKSVKRIYAIDHTHVFKNQTLWDKHCFHQGMRSNDYRDKDILEYNGYDLLFGSKEINEGTLMREVAIFKDNIKEQDLDQIFMSIPPDWQIEPENLLALKEYVLYRISHLDEMCKLIDEWKRR